MMTPEKVNYAQRSFLVALEAGSSYREARLTMERDLGLKVAQAATAIVDSFIGGRDPDRAGQSEYAALLARCLGRTSVQDAYDLLRYAEYFGDSDLAFHLLAQLQSRESNYRLQKHRAKAHKNRGDYPAAAEDYFHALNQALQEGNLPEQAHFLLLYAKLCDRYQQRAGWQKALHRIAFQRLASLFKEVAIPRRWVQISADCLAKVVYGEDRQSGERYFSWAVALAEQDDDTVEVRLEARILEQRLRAALADADFAQIEGLLDSLSAVVARTQAMGNLRAWTARGLGWMRLSRAAYALARRTNEGTTVDVTPSEALTLGDDIDGQFRAFEDDAGVAEVAFEQACWWELVNPLSTDIPVLLRQASSHLERFRDWQSPLYYEVVTSLGSALERGGEFVRAAEAYESAFDHLKGLLDSVIVDERHLRSRDDESDLPAVIRVLAPEERWSVLSELSADYRIITERTLILAERLRAVERRERLDRLRQSHTAVAGIRFHEIAEHLRRVLLKMKGADTEGAEDVQQLIGRVEELYKRQRSLHHCEDFDPADESLDWCRLASRQEAFSRLKLHVVLPSGFKVHFDRLCLHSILDSLASNVVQAAEHVGRLQSKVWVDGYVDRGIFWLSVGDDVGQVAALRKALSRSIEDSVPSARGHGLRLVRTMTRTLDLEQQGLDLVVREDGDIKWLLIPLGRALPP